MIRLFVTGDNHIGRKYQSHIKKEILAKSRITAFEGMVAGANKQKCDIFVITGDLFDNTYDIAKKDIQAVLDILSGFNGAVAILPGNHDYYDKEVKLWQTFQSVAAGYDNILLLSEYRPYKLENVGMDDDEVILYPALCQTKHSEPNENNLGWIRDEKIVPDNKYRILVAHGAVEGQTIDSEGQYFLMKRSELENLPVDVCLMGHTHVPFPNNLTQEYMECDTILNAGTHVQTDVACSTKGLCFIVQIDDDKTVKAKTFVSGNMFFYRKNVVLTAGNMEQEIERELEGIPDNSVVELILSGAVTPDEYDKHVSFLDNALARFTEGSFDDYAMSRLITKERIESEFPETSFSAKFLTALLGDPKEAQLAYDMITRIKGGK